MIVTVFAKLLAHSIKYKIYTLTSSNITFIKYLQFARNCLHFDLGLKQREVSDEIHFNSTSAKSGLLTFGLQL